MHAATPPATSQPDVSHLPESAQRLVALIGLPATVLLVEKHGGKELTLYNRGDSVARIAATIGFDGAASLLHFFGSDPFTVPLCTHALRAVRNAKIHAEYDRLTIVDKWTGKASIHHIVDVFRVGERQVKRILKQESHVPLVKTKPVDPRQMNLL